MSVTVQGFIARVEDMLDALQEVFPDCKKVNKVLNDFRNLVKPNPAMHTIAIQSWHTEVSPYYEHIRKRDVDTLLHADISMFRKIDIASKWQDPQFNQESRQILFEYLDELNKHASFYCGMPPNVMNKIEETAMGLITRLESGAIKPEDMNFQNLSQNILGSMTESDIQEFMQNMPQMQTTMMSMFSGGGGGAALFQSLLQQQQPPR